ncbi:SseB family protein [Ponticaulis profundi]
MVSFIPQNKLEIDLQAARADGGNFAAFLPNFVRASVFVPSVSDVHKNPGDFQPVLFDQEGEPRMIVFTAESRAASVSHVGPYVKSLPVQRLVTGMPMRTGLLVNPGESVGFSISAAGLRRLAADISRN